MPNDIYPHDKTLSGALKALASRLGPKVKEEESTETTLEYPLFTERGKVYGYLNIPVSELEAAEEEAEQKLGYNKVSFTTLLTQKAESSSVITAPLKGAETTIEKGNNVVGFRQDNIPSPSGSDKNIPSPSGSDKNIPSPSGSDKNIPSMTPSCNDNIWGDGIDSLKGIPWEVMIPPRRGAARADRPNNRHGDPRKLDCTYDAYRYVVLHWDRDMLEERRKGWAELRRVFGRDKIGNWLRANLFIITKNYASFGEGNTRNYTYAINQPFYQALKIKLAAAGYDTDEQAIVYAQHKPRLEQQLIDRRIGHWESTDGRWYNVATTCRREVRKVILAEHGYIYDYDIAAAKPTILYQLALKNGFEPKTGNIEIYLSNPKKHRLALVKHCGMEYSAVKEVINLLFGGHIFSYTADNPSIFKHFNSREQYDSFAAATVNLRADLRALLYKLPIERTRNESGRIKPLTEKEPHALYLKAERDIRLAAKQHINGGDSVFWLHDGWTTHTKLNPIELEETISVKTGFNVTIEETILS